LLKAALPQPLPQAALAALLHLAWVTPSIPAELAATVPQVVVRVAVAVLVVQAALAVQAALVGQEAVAAVVALEQRHL